MMQRINENLIGSRSGALPPVGGFMHDATTVSHTAPPTSRPIDRGQYMCRCVTVAACNTFRYSSPRRNIIIGTFLQSADTVMVEGAAGEFL